MSSNQTVGQVLSAWIFNNWRLKLLSVGLAAVLFVGVAFVENPTQPRTISVPLVYQNLPDGVAIVNPPVSIPVVVEGLNADVQGVTAANINATADLSRLKAPSQGVAHVSLAVRIQLLAPRVTLVDPSPNITVNVDQFLDQQLDIDVRTPNVAAGFTRTKAYAQCGVAPPPCQVIVSAPSSLLAGLKAYVEVDGQIGGTTFDVPSAAVQFERNGVRYDLSKQVTLPLISVDPPTVDAHIEMRQGQLTCSAFLLDSAPTHMPPAGYRVTAISISPSSVTLSGPIDQAGKCVSIALPAVDLSGSTSDATFTLPVSPPDGFTTSDAFARVTYSISQNPAAQPTPPSPSPASSPSP